MSKSTGNVVVPDDVLTKFGGNPDPLRFYLSHEVPVGNDGDFSWKRIEELYIGVLSNKIGNLLNRVLVLLQKDGGTFVLQKDDEMTEHIADLWKKFSGQMDAFDISKAIGQAVALAVAGNIHMEKMKPWTLQGEEKIAVLGGIAEMLRHIALMLLPFMPSTAQQMSTQLGVEYADAMLERSFVITEQMKAWGGMKQWTKVGNPAILFAQLK
jgi:methionyl-tRNA synthetase